MSFKLSKRSIERLQGVDPRMLDIVDRALQLSKVDFGIPEHGGVRTEIQQHTLFTRGVSKADGRHHRSNHQDGIAVDVFGYVDRRAVWDITYMAQIACAMLQAANELGHLLRWGGHWENLDTPHFELAE